VAWASRPCRGLETTGKMPAPRGPPAVTSPHFSQSSPPLRSLFCTRHICWRWSQDMRARFKTAPLKKDQSVKQTEKRLPAGTLHNPARRSAKRSFWGGFTISPDVSAGRLGMPIVNKLHVGYRVECETSGLGTCRAPPAMFLNKRLAPFGVDFS
jgi:hypothetical protein